MKKKSLKILSFGVLLIITFVYLNRVFEPSHLYHNSISEFKTLSQKEPIDVLFFGNSHAFTAFAPQSINNDNFFTYNLASPLLKQEVVNLALEEALKYNTPKLIVLEVCETTVSVTKDTTAKGKDFQFRILDQVSFFSKGKRRFLSKNFEDNLYLPSFFPLFREKGNWNKIELFKLNKKVSEENTDYYYFLGFQGLKKSILTDQELEDYSNFATREPFYNEVSILDSETQEHLKRFVQIAKQKDIQVLFVSAPEMRARYRNYFIFKELERLAKEIEVDYLNLNDHFESLDLESLDFFDTQHVNSYGAIKTSNFIKMYIEENYNINNITIKKSFSEELKKGQRLNEIYSNKLPQTFNKQVDFTFNEDISIKEIEIERVNTEYTLKIKLDHNLSNNENLEKYNLSLKLIPNETDKKYLNKKSVDIGYQSFDFELKGLTGFTEYKFTTALRDIKSIQMFLYDSNGYSGVLGDRFILENPVFVNDN